MCHVTMDTDDINEKQTCETSLDMDSYVVTLICYIGVKYEGPSMVLSYVCYGASKVDYKDININ